VKTITIVQDIGVVVGRGHIVEVSWEHNAPLGLGDVIKIKGKVGYFIVQDTVTPVGALTGTVAIRTFEGAIAETVKSLEDAKCYVEARRDEGVPCPCCTQYCKVYPRSLNAPMVRFLIWLVKEFEARNVPRTWINVNDGPLIQHRKGGGDFAKMAHWGLIEQMANDDDTKRTSGYWRPTQAGVDFVHMRTTVPQKVLLYLNEPVGFSPEVTDVVTALGTGFDYRELMNS